VLCSQPPRKNTLPQYAGASPRRAEAVMAVEAEHAQVGAIVIAAE